MNRKSFLKNSLIASAGIISYPVLAENNSISPIEIKEFVIAGHSNIDKVKEMFEENPGLVYVKHDWGGGDFESAIEGAGHVGNTEIADYLISKGARVNIFTMTMLGNYEIVTSILELYPELLYSKGPHGFTLLHHAKVGGQKSDLLYSYLQEKGLNEFKLPLS